MKAVKWIAAIVLVLVAASGGLWFWMIGQPMYAPGAGAQLELDPISRNTDSAWQVSTDISLHHFASGTGSNVLYVHGGPGIPSTSTAPGLDLSGYRVHYYDQRGSGQSSRPFNGAVSSSMYKSPIQELAIHRQGVGGVKRLSIIRIMARRTKATVVLA